MAANRDRRGRWSRIAGIVLFGLALGALSACNSAESTAVTPVSEDPGTPIEVGVPVEDTLSGVGARRYSFTTSKQGPYSLNFAFQTRNTGTGIGGTLEVQVAPVQNGAYFHVECKSDYGTVLSECMLHDAVLGGELRAGLTYTFDLVVPGEEIVPYTLVVDKGTGSVQGSRDAPVALEGNADYTEATYLNSIPAGGYSYFMFTAPVADTYQLSLTSVRDTGLGIVFHGAYMETYRSPDYTGGACYFPDCDRRTKELTFSDRFPTVYILVHTSRYDIFELSLLHERPPPCLSCPLTLSRPRPGYTAQVVLPAR